MNLMPANELDDISKASCKLLEKEALESDSFRRLVNLIEDKALNGRNRAQFHLLKEEDKRILSVFKNALEEAGYNVEYSLFNSTILLIRWSGES